MADLFASPRLTLARAKHHIDEFEALVNKFIASKPWTSLVDKDTNPGRDLHKIRFTPFPEMLPCILFDAANNLRAVLDQVGYASAVAARSPLLKATKFPFGPSEEKWRNDVAGGCKDLPPEVRAIFERHKSYPGGNDSLWATNEIANAAKHLALKPLVVASPSAFYNARITDHRGTGYIVSPGGFGIGWDAEKREVTLLDVPTGAQADINSNVSFEGAINDIEVLASQPAVSVLSIVYREVGTILGDVETECRHLGFI